MAVLRATVPVVKHTRPVFGWNRTALALHVIAVPLWFGKLIEDLLLNGGLLSVLSCEAHQLQPRSVDRLHVFDRLHV